MLKEYEKKGVLDYPRYTIGNGFQPLAARQTRVMSFGGMKEFEGTSIGGQHWSGIHTSVSADILRDHFRVWRADEVMEASRLLSEKDRLLIVGRPQSGKGTILYGLSNVCDTVGVGYLFIDGHHQETPVDEIIAAIDKAEANGHPIFFDSFDYGFAGTRKLREIPKDVQKERTQKIVQRLERINVPLVLTMHEPFWAGLFLDQQMLEEYREFLDSFSVYNLPRTIASPESQHAFLTDHDFSEAETEVLMSIPNNPVIREHITALGDKGVLDELNFALMDYATLKLLVRDRQTETKRLIADLIEQKSEAPGKVVQLIRDCLRESDFLATLRASK